IFHHFLTIVDDTHRPAPSPNGDNGNGNGKKVVPTSEDPFSMDVLKKIFQDAGIQPDKLITFDAFCEATESQALTFHACPLFQIEDVNLPSGFGKSRPSSAAPDKAKSPV
ncbi:hypothetical protein HK097_006649, partial [Rhizophlyctis rosea]